MKRIFILIILLSSLPIFYIGISESQVSKRLGASVWVPSAPPFVPFTPDNLIDGEAYDVVVDNPSFLYICGYRITGGSITDAIVEKRRLSDGVLIQRVIIPTSLSIFPPPGTLPIATFESLIYDSGNLYVSGGVRRANPDDIPALAARAVVIKFLASNLSTTWTFTSLNTSSGFSGKFSQDGVNLYLSGKRSTNSVRTSINKVTGVSGYDTIDFGTGWGHGCSLMGGNLYIGSQISGPSIIKAVALTGAFTSITDFGSGGGLLGNFYNVESDGTFVFGTGGEQSVPGPTPTQYYTQKFNAVPASVWVQKVAGSGVSALSSFIESPYIYTCGGQISGVLYKYRLERRALSDGSLSWFQTATDDSVRNGVVVSGNFLYSVGFDIPGGGSPNRWLIERRNKNTGVLE